MTRVICFDTETTGFEYARGDRIIEIGAVEIIDGRVTGNTFHEYINPDGKIIPMAAYAVHKISNDFLEDKPKFKEVATRFMEFIGDDSIIVAHNGSGFDFPFFNYELVNHGFTPLPFNRLVDTITLASNKVFGPKSFSLDSLAKWFGVSLATRSDSHGALIDAEILAKVYLEIEQVDAKESISDTIERERQELQNIPKNGANFPRRTFPVSTTEIENFDTFISKNIKEPLWNTD